MDDKNKNILAHVDHTLLSQTATEDDIKKLLDEAMAFGVAAVCIPPCYVAFAKEYTKGKVVTGTVVGFPNGYVPMEIKVAETNAYITAGADEIDMVININALKNGYDQAVLEEIKAVKAAAGDRIVKVIIETCLLTEDEKIRMCKIVSDSGADYIKTSTGFSTGGAIPEDIKLFKTHLAAHVKMKAAGGIASLADAQMFLDLGVERLGTSRIVKILNNKHVQAEGY